MMTIGAGMFASKPTWSAGILPDSLGVGMAAVSKP
jgi:hypothetical protein